MAVSPPLLSRILRMPRSANGALILLGTSAICFLLWEIAYAQRSYFVQEWLRTYQAKAVPLDNPDDQYFTQLALAALEQTKSKVIYDSAYRRIAYPNGDIPFDRGVCADVVVRAYRALGTDLQKLVHEDMQQNFPKYPNLWHLGAPDTNIDHRRVPNLMVFFQRFASVLPISSSPVDYRTGDIVAWDLGGGVTHMGVVLRQAPADNPLVIHNIGAGPKLQDVLFSWKIIGVFRYKPK